MKNNPLVIKLVFMGLAILLIVYFILTSQNERRYQWVESYSTTSDQPYGTLFIQKLLADYRPGQKFTLNDKVPLHKILDTAEIKTKTDYIFIGRDIYLDDADKNALLNFISSGNDAFIAVVNLPFYLVDSMFISECGREIFLTTADTLSVNLNFYNNTLKKKEGYTYAYRFGKKDLPYFWNTLNPEIFCDSTQSITPIGYVDPDKVNFFKLSYGEGNLYVHTNPLVFTNYFLVTPDKAEYASSVFSNLKGESIIWDEFSKSAFMPKNNAPEISPLSYIIQQDSLRYAWWLMLVAAVLYTLFTAKRKQRLIPVLEEKKNTSLEFVNLIAALHFQNGYHRDTAKKKMKYFFYFVRTRYGMHSQHLTGVILQRLAEKSKVQLEDLTSIVREFEVIELQNQYDENKLVTLHHALERFYKNCK